MLSTTAKIRTMIDVIYYFSQLELAQLIAALIFVPLACWFHGIHSTIACRWCALFFGYVIQIGLFLVLDDVGFDSNLLILLASIVAYFGITTTTSFWTQRKLIPIPVKENS